MAELRRWMMGGKAMTTGSDQHTQTGPCERPLPWKTILIALVRHLQLHDGIWELNFEFGLAGAKINFNSCLSPAAFVPIVRMNLARVNAVTDLSVDAAVVNPVVATTDVVCRPHLHDVNRTENCWCGAAPGEPHLLVAAQPRESIQ